MKVLVTGGLGFIGSHLVDALVEIGHDVVVLDDLSTGSLDNANKDAHNVFGTLASVNNDIMLDNLFKEHRFEYVFHLAAQINLRKSIENPYNDANINILGSLVVINACIKYGAKLIFSSTGGAIYSSDEDLPFTEVSLAKPSSPYGLAKLTVESYLEIMKSLYGLEYVALRYSNVYGPRQNAHGEAGVISIFIDKLSRKEKITIYGDGEQTRDFIYVNDVVMANLMAMPLESGVFNIGTDTEISINYIAQALLMFTYPTSSSFFGKMVHAPAIPGEMLRCKLSSIKFTNITGWTPHYSFDIGLTKTLGV